MMELLAICVYTTYFQVEDKFCQKDFSMEMEPPVLINIYIEEFE